MDTDKQYILGDLIRIELNKYNYVWIGCKYGGNYDIFTGDKYIPDNVDNKTLGSIMNRDDYYNMFPKEYPKIEVTSLYNKLTNMLPF